MTDRKLSKFRVLGTDVVDMKMTEALSLLQELMTYHRDISHSIYFVNAHTLNVASRDPMYRDVLKRGSYVFADGTGVRWAVRIIYGKRLKDNLNGTDLVPQLFRHLAGKGYRYYLLGAKRDVIERAADYAVKAFSGWTLAGFHHGYLPEGTRYDLVSEINRSDADMLLVGMGNPIQEIWIDKHLEKLRIPLCLGVGGLFTYWARDLKRAPLWMRNIGVEWLYLLSRQPHKFNRYVIGNPLFLYRVARQRVSTKKRV